uniref:Arrestin domain-containing protein 3-like n=1 Tax=Phallusia mammillata TaxID=59560 RepID=A0A6F9D7N5_9ASCI|nr:arrestin domain-containing protein 3-like [Phallusia mammillata]
MGPKIRVEFAKHPAVFSPGEKVEGKVLVSADDLFKARAIEVRFRGKAHNAWYDGGRKTYYEKQEYYADEQITVWPSSGRSWDGDSLPSGVSEFPFTFALSENSPCTFEGSVGWVRYTIYAKIDIPSGLDKCTKELFTVVPMTDLNKDPQAKIIPKIFAEKKQGYFGGRPLLVEASCDKGGYVPGEVINIFLTFKNDSEYDVTAVKVKLEQKSKFYGKAWGTLTYVSKSSAAKIKEHIAIKENATGEWRGKILIPSLPPSDLPGCSIIDLKHRLQIRVTCKKNVDLTLPIRIGTFPLLPEDTSPQNYPPPAYVESVFGSVDAKEKDDGDAMSESAFTPLYAYYDWSASPYSALREEMNKVSTTY